MSGGDLGTAGGAPHSPVLWCEHAVLGAPASPTAIGAAAAAAERRPQTAPEGASHLGGRPRGAGRTARGGVSDGQGIQSRSPLVPGMAPVAVGGWRRPGGNSVTGGAALKAAQAEMDALLAGPCPNQPRAPGEQEPLSAEPGNSACLATARLRLLCDQVDAERLAITREMKKLRGMCSPRDDSSRDDTDRDAQLDALMRDCADEGDNGSTTCWDAALQPRLQALQRAVETLEQRRAELAAQQERERQDQRQWQDATTARLGECEVLVGSCGGSLEQQDGLIEELVRRLREEREARELLERRVAELERRHSERPPCGDGEQQRLHLAELAVAQQGKEQARLQQLAQDVSERVGAAHVRDSEWRAMAEQQHSNFQKGLDELQRRMARLEGHALSSTA